MRHRNNQIRCPDRPVSSERLHGLRRFSRQHWSRVASRREMGQFPCVRCPHLHPLPAGRGDVEATVLARRKPRLLFRFDGSFLLRLAARQFSASFLQLPPRITRFEPLLHRPLHPHSSSSLRNASTSARRGSPTPPQPPTEGLPGRRRSRVSAASSFDRYPRQEFTAVATWAKITSCGLKPGSRKPAEAG